MAIVLENIAVCATTMLAAHLLLFTSFYWLWQKQQKPVRGTTFVFLIFMLTFMLHIAAAVFAIGGLAGSAHVLVAGYVAEPLTVFAIWLRTRAREEKETELCSKAKEARYRRRPHAGEDQS